MKRKVMSAALLACSVVILGTSQPSFSQEYKLREAAQYIKDRDGAEVPNVRTSAHFALKWGDKNDLNFKMDEEYAQKALEFFEHIRTIFKDVVGLPLVKSEAEKYKTNIYVTRTGLKPFLEGYAFGFPDPEGYGVFCAEPSVMTPGHSAAAHELGHATQGETGNFRDSDYVGFFWECHAQFMAQQVIPTKALPQRLDLYCDMAHFDFSTAANWRQYANWIFLQYLKEKPGYGYPFINSLWLTKATHQNEDPINKMKRLGKLSPVEWADLFGDYAKRNVTFSTYEYGKEYLESIEKRGEKATWRWKMALEPIKGSPNWYRIPYAAAPQQHAYSVIPLTPTSNTVAIEFRGFVDDYRKSDWRATIVAVNDKKQDRFSQTINSGRTSIRLQPNENEVYLVVAATPHVFDPIKSFSQDYRTQERFPYEVMILGADPKGKYPAKLSAPEGVAGIAHPNGGGFVAATAKVDASAYVGPNARVLDNAQVKDNARIEDYAVVSKDAVVSENAIVSGCALVTDKATVSGNARVRDYARVYENAKVEANVRLLEYAVAQGNAHVHGNVVARSYSNLNGGNLHGTALFTGATNPGRDITDCSKGVYTIYMGQPDCDKAKDFGGLYANYDFNRLNSLLLRDKMARADGFLVGGPEWVKDGRRGYCLSFDGATQYVEMPKSISDLRDFDLSVMVNWAGGAAGQKVFDFGCDTANCMYFTPKSESGSAAFVIVSNGRKESLEAGALPVGEWCKVTISVKGDEATMLINDQQVASGTITANPEDLKADSNFLARGQSGGFFKGQIDELRVYITD